MTLKPGKSSALNQIPADELRLMIRAALLYYEEGMTQNQTAKSLGVSRVKVTRLIAKAKSLGIVEIRINQPPGFFVEQEQALIQKFNLKDAMVTLDFEDPEALRRALATAAGHWLIPKLDQEGVVGFSMGRTLALLPDLVEPEGNTGTTFIEVMGASDSLNSGFSSYTVIGRMAALFGGQARLLDVPTIVSSKEMRDLILQEEQIKTRFEMSRSCDILLTSVGTVDEEALLYQIGYLTDDVLQQLKEAGAVGDLLGQFFDAEGTPVDNPLTGRIMALQLEELRQIPYSVLVSGGADKVTAILAAMRGSYVNVLVTDAHTAQQLLESNHPNKE
jgi:DNA-binding transcriptional regulator LsrR (DeoR family)